MITMRSSYLKNSRAISTTLAKVVFMSALITTLSLHHALQAKTVEWPADSVQWRSSELAGYALAQQKCSTCHSAHYAEYQPPNAGAGYWKAQVLRMKTVFKAPITDDEVQSVVDYLSQTYGSSRK